MDVQRVVREIHARVEERTRVTSLSQRENEELTALRSAYGRLFQMRNAVGRMPPSPNTFRARIGRYLVQVVQRGLFWYTPQIVAFHNEAAHTLDAAGDLIIWQLQRTGALARELQKVREAQQEQISAFETEIQKLRVSQSERIAALEDTIRRLRAEAQGLQAEIHRLETIAIAAIHMRSSAQGSENRVDAPLSPRDFEFHLQDHFRGSEQETAAKLQPYLTAIQSELTPIPRAPWLDAGCGRGEWLELASGAGYSILGIDSNPAALARCRGKGLRAEEGDALSYLLSTKSASLAVITAFHLVEHWPFSYLLAFIQQAVRTLQPGGLLIIETPNPANLRMAAFHFWHDPTHCRVVPPALLEFAYQYFGLTVAKRLDMNPSPSNELLPFDEISLVRRLNEYLHGPQDYGLIGRCSRGKYSDDRART